MSVPAALKFTYEDYCLLPEDRRYEVIDGEPFVTPAPTPKHQEIVLALARLLADLVQTHGLGKVYVSPCDVVLSKFDVLQPDVFFIGRDRLATIGEKYIDGAPDLVIEVLSPTTASRDREAKAKRYATFGVREMWLVDPAARTIEVLINKGEGFERRLLAVGSDVIRSIVLKDLELAAERIFRPI